MGDCMSFFDILLLDIIFILFPIICILIIKSNVDEANNIKKDFLIDIANFSSIFLLIKYGDPCPYSVLLVNIPFFISVVYNRKIATVIIACILFVFNSLNGLNAIFVFSEYIIYIVLFLLLYNKRISYNVILNFFIFIKGLFLTILEFYIMHDKNVFSLAKIFISLVIFYIITVLIVNIINIIEKSVSLNITLKELEKEKELKESLFKITHEVKNPIAVCKGYLSMMDYTNIRTVKKYNKIIYEELNRTLDIMDNFSEYTKINVKLDLMDLDSLIYEVVDSFKILSGSKNIDINYDYDDEIYIKGDYARLKQVFVNLIKNSIEAIEKDGKIIISIGFSKKHVIVKIKDNGPGIGAEELSKIDELFYSSKEKGCGIGVSLSKEIVKLHNGTMKYSSIVGEYTEVILKFPKADLHQKV